MKHVYKDCLLTCDRDIMTANDAKCYELRKSHLSCFECKVRDDANNADNQWKGGKK